jgi:hypothetical protein
MTRQWKITVVPRALLRRIGMIEIAVAIQLISPALLMIPSMQALRMPIRVLQYGSSLGFLAFYYRRWLRNGWPPGGKLLVLCVALMLAALFSPGSVWAAGAAQIVFQLCIVAPLFWAGAMVRDPERLRRLVWAVLLANALSAGVGLLQVYYPAQFLPREYSPDFRENLSMLSYSGAGGREIVRPPGLTDTPGGAASAGLLCGLLGLVLATNPRERRAVRLFALGCCLLGITILYLTFVRSLTLALLASFLAVSLVRNRRAPGMKFARVGVLAAAMVVLSFWIATAVGGEAVAQRFLDIPQTGVLETYNNSRGIFVKDAFTRLLPENPFGVGVGRWGMMCQYFCDFDDPGHPPLYAEIQLTGWIYDGGAPLLLAYLAALGAALWYSFRIAARHRDPEIAVMAKCILAVQICLVGTILGGPTFNTLLGSQFWLMAGALFGAARGYARNVPAAGTKWEFS